MANEWLDDERTDDEWAGDEAAYQEALDGAPADGDGADVRYGLTPLGALALDEGARFGGFGPCAATCAFPVAPPPAAGRKRALERGRRRRPTPLFG